MNKSFMAALFVCFALFGGACNKEGMKAPEEPKPYAAPSFTLTDLSGKQVSLAEYKGKPVVLNFWASWCVPCKAEMPELQKLRDARKNSGLEVLAVNFKESPETAAAFAKKGGFSLTFLLDEKGKTASEYQVFGLPTTYFLDGAGLIRHNYMGEMTKEIINGGLKKISVEEY